jgi:DNA-binding winged helix-turn-helix (wHTH) protein/TolB-like protein/Tfp pilus assembly protein PilF
VCHLPLTTRQYGENGGLSSHLTLVVSNFILGMAHATEQRIYEFGDFRIDVDHRMLYHQGSETPLVPKAVETLLALIERRGKIISKDELLEAVWPDTVVEESSLFVYLSVLRKTLGALEDGRPYVETLRRRGYRFNGDVHLVEQEIEDKNHQLTVDEFEQSRANIQSPSARLHIVKKVIEPIDSFRSATTDSLSVNDLPTDLSVWRQTNPVNDLPEPRRDWPLRRSSFAAIGVIALLALALSYTYFSRRRSINPRSINSIAVIPFANESGDPNLEYLSDGLADTLIESLSEVQGLEVKAHSTVVRYKGSDARRIGQDLNVEVVLKGRLIKTGEDLTLLVELVDSRNENSLWRQNYGKVLSGLVVLQSQLARDLVDELSVPITDKTREEVAKHGTENSDANRLYIEGVFHARKITEQDIKQAIDLFSQAIQKDPSYAKAYAAMASARRSLTLCCDGHPSELVQAKDAAQKAVALDDKLAEGHSALAAVIWMHDWKWAEAEKEFQRALELDPNSAIVHFQYGDFLGRMGRSEEAAAQKDRAAELEPYEPFFAARVGSSQSSADPEKALKQILKAIDLDRNYWFSHVMAASVYSQRKEYDKAIGEAQLSKKLSPNQTWSDVNLSSIFVNAGRPEEARVILDQLLLRSKSRFVPPYHIAMVYNNLGDKERALYWLEKAYDIRDAKMAFLKTMPWKNVKDDPRFQDIVRRVGLPVAK